MTPISTPWKHGATQLASGEWNFRVWAPEKKSLQLRILDPIERVLPMEPQLNGYHQLILDDLPSDARYFFRVEGRDLPDPASRFTAANERPFLAWPRPARGLPAGGVAVPQLVPSPAAARRCSTTANDHSIIGTAATAATTRATSTPSRWTRATTVVSGRSRPS